LVKHKTDRFREDREDKPIFDMRSKLIGAVATAVVITAATMGCTVPSRTRDEPPPTLDAEIAVDAGRKLGRVNRLLFGSYVIAPGGGNGLLPGNGDDFDPESLAMVKELSPTILRLGVLPVFEDALGNWRNRREARCGWESWHTHEYGLDEHMLLLEKIGAPGQALITVGYPYGLADSSDPQSCVVEKANLSQTVKRAAALVAYANGDPADRTAIGVDDNGFDWRTVGYWARRRAENGHPAPYGIKYWEIGNEIYYEDIPVQQYAADFLVFYDEMKRVDPQIIVAASARLEPRQQDKWNIPLLSAIGSKVDALVLHMYYPLVDRGSDLDKVVMASATQADKHLQYTRELLARYTDRPQEIKLILGENGLLYSGNYEDAQTWNTLLAGLYDVDMIGTFVQRNADYHLALGIQHFLQGASPTADILYDWETKERYRRPDYYALQMWTRHFGDTLLQTTVRCGTFDIPRTYGNVGPLADIPYLAVHASISGETRLYLLVVNRNLTEDVRAKISINEFAPQATGRVYTLNGPDIRATNEDGNHDTIKIKESTISALAREFAYTFPAHSVTVLELEKR
jgi:alpha-L-arabinofuranosidase